MRGWAGMAAMALAAAAAPGGAQTIPDPAIDDGVAPPSAPTRAGSAAERFTLDLAAPAEVPAAPSPDTAAPPAPAAADARKARFSIDTPIVRLLENYRAKAVLDREMPGLSVDKNLAKFQALSLRKLAPASGGRLTPDLLDKVGRQLEAIE